jgi:hypothetical protein
MALFLLFHLNTSVSVSVVFFRDQFAAREVVCQGHHPRLQEVRQRGSCTAFAFVTVG